MHRLVCELVCLESVKRQQITLLLSNIVGGDGDIKDRVQGMDLHCN